MIYRIMIASAAFASSLPHAALRCFYDLDIGSRAPREETHDNVIWAFVIVWNAEAAAVNQQQWVIWCSASMSISYTNYWHIIKAGSMQPRLDIFMKNEPLRLRW